MNAVHRISERGAANRLFIATIGLSIFGALALVAAIWGIVNYMDQKTNVDGKVADAVTLAKKQQADSDDAKFQASEKQPNREFVGPDDYGRLTFSYPKTWSVYVDKDGTSGTTYQAYLNPVSVPPVSSSSTEQYALRITIEQRDYATVLASYGDLVKKGTLRSSAFTVDGSNGTRLDGNFTKDIRGSAVIFKIRDTTLTMRTDADTFDTDFNALIATIKFNQ